MGHTRHLIVIKREKVSSLFPATYINYFILANIDRVRLIGGCYPSTTGRKTSHIIVSKNSLTYFQITPIDASIYAFFCDNNEFFLLSNSTTTCRCEMYCLRRAMALVNIHDSIIKFK